jgi:hypothetical protein
VQDGLEERKLTAEEPVHNMAHMQTWKRERESQVKGANEDRGEVHQTDIPLSLWLVFRWLLGDNLCSALRR